MNNTGTKIAKALPVSGALGKVVSKNLGQLGYRTKEFITGGIVGVAGEYVKSGISEKKSSVGDYILAITFGGFSNTLPFKRDSLMQTDPSKEIFKASIGAQKNIPEWQKLLIEIGH